MVKHESMKLVTFRTEKNDGGIEEIDGGIEEWMEKEQEHCLNLNLSSRAGSGRKKTASRIYRGDL